MSICVVCPFGRLMILFGSILAGHVYLLAQLSSSGEVEVDG